MGDAGGMLAPGSAGLHAITLRDGTRDGAFILDHHLLMLVTVGHGTHEVDFATYECRPGTLLWARPGQAVRFGGQPGLDATLVSWTHRATAPPVSSWRHDETAHDETAHDETAYDEMGYAGGVPPGPTYWQLAGEDEDAVINEVSQLMVDCERHHAGDLPAVLLHQQLAVLLLRIGLLGPAAASAQIQPDGGVQSPPDAPDRETFRRFREDLEQGYARTRRVDDYAARLGCCVRTLTRASLVATGRTAKQVVDGRVALQAKRLLAGTDLPVAEIGRRLGFAEPTNFGRFFQREAGLSPGAFRQRHTGHVAPPRFGVPEARRPLEHIASQLQA
jgi:AraC-like DNA-binding protein